MKKALTILFILSFSSVYATTCSPLKSTIIAKCDINGCHDLLFIKEVIYGIECARRSVIYPTPDWAKNVIENEISSSLKSIESATYQLDIHFYRRWFSEINSNIDQFILNRSENKYSNLVQLYKYPKNEYLNQKTKWQIYEKTEFLKMVFTYFFNGCLMLFIVFIEVLFLFGLNNKNIKQTTLSTLLFVLLSYLSSFISLESFNQLIAIVWIPLLLVINLLVMLIDKVHRLKEKQT